MRKGWKKVQIQSLFASSPVYIENEKKKYRGAYNCIKIVQISITTEWNPL